jgi:hypothetical protein
MPFATTPVIRYTCLAVALASTSVSAFANAFIPTMISANVVWLFVLAPIVAIEGRLMARWAWERPYKTALNGNLVSMLAALPFGVLLSMAGGYLASAESKSTFPYLSDSARFFLAQALFYGDPPVPSYGFIVVWSMAGIFFAALIFIGFCWLLTFAVEGYYYSRKNPSRPRIEIFRRTALANVASYCFLIVLWLPYSYYSASSEQDSGRRLCAEPSSWSSRCTEIWEKFPEGKKLRLAACGKRAIPEERCLERSN